MATVISWCDEQLRLISSATGLERLKFDPDGVCALEVDDMLVRLETRREGTALLLTARMGQAPEQDRATLYARLLDANVNFFRTGGATLAVMASGGDVLLQREFSAANGEFMPLMAAFMDMATHWRKELEDARSGVVTARELPPAMESMMRV